MKQHFSDDGLAFLENRLTPEARARAEAHLRDCAECRAQLGETRRAITALNDAGRALGRVPMRSGWAAVRQRLSGPDVFPRRARAPMRVPWQASVTISMVALALVSNLTLNPVRAATPNVPLIQTPAAMIATVSDAATVQVVRVSQSTLAVPTRTPGPRGG
jgi:anti-sigma factor RsiW